MATSDTNPRRNSWNPGQIRPDQLPEDAVTVPGFDRALVGYGYVLSTVVTVYDRSMVEDICTLNNLEFPANPAGFAQESCAIVGDPTDAADYAARFDADTSGDHAAALIGFFKRGDAVDQIVDRQAFLEILASEMAEYADPNDEDSDPYTDADEMISSGSEGGWYGPGSTPLMLNTTAIDF